MPATCLAARIVARLAQAEVLESNPHYRDDLRIARLTVAYAASGEAALCSPHVLASYTVLGLHPEKVWPAIQARRKALGVNEEFWGWNLPPKKPPLPAVGRSQQKQKLWCEKTSGARAGNSRAALPSSGEPAISVPMAAPSIAALFPNSDQSSSAKKRQFTLEEMKLIVWRSYAPDWLRIVTLAALEARGEWPNEQGRASSVLSVALRGIQIESSNAPKRTTQYRIKRACDLNYWRKLRDDNSWSNCPKCGKARQSRACGGCNYTGRVKDANGRYTGEFSRPAVYEFNLEKFLTAPPRCREIHSVDWRTYAEYKAAAKRGEHPNVTEMPRKPAAPIPPPKSPAPAAPLPERAKPAAAEHPHRGTERSTTQPKMTKRECAKFIADMALCMRGQNGKRAIDGSWVEFLPGDPRYFAPMKWREALAAVCREWKRTEESVTEALKFWGYQLQE